MSQQIEINIPELLRKGLLFWILLGILVIVGFITSIYTVQAESQGVVLRFGSYLTTVDPGAQTTVWDRQSGVFRSKDSSSRSMDSDSWRNQ